jgi:hypothetical protein
MYLVLFLAGVVAGSALRYFPGLLFPHNVPELPAKEFLAAHPRLRWIPIVFPLAYFFNFFLFGIAFAMYFRRFYPANGDMFVIFWPMFLFVATEVPKALIELTTKVSANWYGRGGRYRYHPHAIAAGVSRLLLFLALGIAAYYLCALHPIRFVPPTTDPAERGAISLQLKYYFSSKPAKSSESMTTSPATESNLTALEFFRLGAQL